MGGTLAMLKWLLRPSKNRASEVYDLLSTGNNLGEKSLYLNLGYWEKARSYDEAAAALAEHLGEAAGLTPFDEVLDVGFGFGDQDLYWLARFSPRRIVGLNITASQVAVAQKRVRQAAAQDRIELREGSATAMPLPSESVTKVLALETAFHFDTRWDFFSEAYRVLKPGGRLAVADIIPLRPNSGPLDWAADFVGRSFWQIPKGNQVPAADYLRRLEAAGFVNARLRSIREQVYAPFARYAGPRLDQAEVRARMDPAVRAFFKASLPVFLDGGTLDYVIAVADKPAQENDHASGH